MARNQERGSFSSFQDMGKLMKQEQERRAAESTKETFERVAAGKFGLLAKGNFRSELPGVDSITLLPVESKNKDSRALHIIPFYKNSNGKESHATLTLNEKGILSGELPGGMQFTKDELVQEALRIMEQVQMADWHITDTDLIPEQDELVAEGEGGDGGGDMRIDPERLAFLQKQEHAKFKAVCKKDGFDGYRLVLFDGQENDFVILDHDVKPNAAFIVELGQKVDVPDELNHDQKEQLLKSFWDPIMEKAPSKGTLKEIGTKIVHNATWQSRMQDHIDKRLPGKQMAGA